MRIWTVLFYAFYLSCRLALGATDSFSGLAASREKAREVLKIHCGACHLPSSPFVQQEALKIYDLSNLDWASTMLDRQLQDSVRRLKERVGMTSAELMYVVPKGAKIPNKPKADEIQALENYVSLELLERATKK